MLLSAKSQSYLAGRATAHRLANVMSLVYIAYTVMDNFIFIRIA